MSLYESHRKIYARSVKGVFNRWRWVFVWLTQAIFYGLPWLRWNGRAALLFDLPARRFYLFGTVLYPQDFIYLTGLLVISAMSLFLFTAVAGRLWCGYACPQTVYSEIFMWIERQVEGDRPRRILLDRAPMTAGKAGRKAAKHALWLVVAGWTGITFVGYFTGIRPLLGDLAGLAPSGWELFWVVFYGFTTWGNAGFMREQVCKYMCPYARFQSSMFDRDTLIIGYDPERGEPRGPRSVKADRARLALGDCTACNRCVEVCPTGIDIRDGLQYECIGCAACIDACDSVMDRMGYARGLVRYDTENGMRNHWTRRELLRHAVRPRVLVYTAMLLAVTVALFTHMALRSPLKVDVLRDRGVMGREVEEGMVENVYRLQLISSAETRRSYRISVSGIESAFVASNPVAEVEAAGTRQVPVSVRVKPGAARPGMNKIEFEVTSTDGDPVTVREKSTFYVPQ